MNEWSRKKDILNVTFIEQKQKDLITEKGRMQYEFIRADYNECVELFAMDLLKILEPEIVSRLITLHRIVYGDRTEIEAVLVSIVKNCTE